MPGCECDLGAGFLDGDLSDSGLLDELHEVTNLCDVHVVLLLGDAHCIVH